MKFTSLYVILSRIRYLHGLLLLKPITKTEALYFKPDNKAIRKRERLDLCSVETIKELIKRISTAKAPKPYQVSSQDSISLDIEPLKSAEDSIKIIAVGRRKRRQHDENTCT